MLHGAERTMVRPSTSSRPPSEEDEESTDREKPGKGPSGRRAERRHITLTPEEETTSLLHILGTGTNNIRK